MNRLFAKLHHDCAALGTRLFTLSALDEKAQVFRRAYTSHPAEYPLSGTKPMTLDGWHDHCIRRREVFIANTPPEFAKYFFDHELIASLGLGSCVNIPIHDARGPVVGTVNLLAETGHFSDDRLASYKALVARALPGLFAELPATLDA